MRRSLELSRSSSKKKMNDLSQDLSLQHLEQVYDHRPHLNPYLFGLVEGLVGAPRGWNAAAQLAS